MSRAGGAQVMRASLWICDERRDGKDGGESTATTTVSSTSAVWSCLTDT